MWLFLYRWKHYFCFLQKRHNMKYSPWVSIFSLWHLCLCCSIMGRILLIWSVCSQLQSPFRAGPSISVVLHLLRVEVGFGLSVPAGPWLVDSCWSLSSPFPAQTGFGAVPHKATSPISSHAFSLWGLWPQSLEVPFSHIGYKICLWRTPSKQPFLQPSSSSRHYWGGLLPLWYDVPGACLFTPAKPTIPHVQYLVLALFPRGFGLFSPWSAFHGRCRLVCSYDWRNSTGMSFFSTFCALFIDTSSSGGPALSSFLSSGYFRCTEV